MTNFAFDSHLYLPTVANVMKVYKNANAEDIRDGMEWYSDANAFAAILDPKNVSRAAGIIAALSPMNGWENNKNKAAQLYRQNGDGTGCGLLTNVAKAVSIYGGRNALDVLKGDKVRAFYSTIVEPSGDVSPVIDRHAFDIAVGMRAGDKPKGILSRKGVYDAFADVYREAAVIAGIGAPQMQAVTWVTWRRIHGIIA